MSDQPPTIGVLALQGDVAAHLRALEEAGAAARPVRRLEELDRVSGLVIPGGESSVVGMLLERYGLMTPLRERIEGGLPVFGTCTGVILLAREIVGSEQPRIGALDVSVLRNAYGRQVDSFEADVSAPGLGDEPLRGVFIRAPRIVRAGPAVQVMAETDDGPVLVRQGNLLGSTFHPELTPDRRIHELFVQVAQRHVAGPVDR